MKNLAFVIEDDEDLAGIFSEALRASGFDVEIIADGTEAQKQLQLKVPEIIVLDMHLPHIDGGTLLSEIRSNELLKNTKVMIATADALMADLYQELADFVLIKPISFSQLRDLSKRLRSQ